MRHIKHLSIAILGTALASTAFGSHASSKQNWDSGSSALSGFYVGGLIGAGTETDGVNTSGGSSGSNTGFAAGVNVGYNFTPVWAAEFGAMYLPGSSASFGSLGSASADVYLFDLALKPTMNINDKVSVYGKVGLGLQHSSVSSSGMISTSSSSTDAALYVGVGAGYHLTEQLQLVADLAGSFSGDMNTYSYTGGVSYAF